MTSVQVTDILTSALTDGLTAVSVACAARRIDNERRWFSAAQRVLQNVDLQPETRRWVEATVMEALARPPPSSSAEIPTPPSTAPSGTAQQATGGREQAAESASGRAAYGDGTRQSTAPSAAHVQGHPTGTVQEPWEANPSDPQVTRTKVASHQ
jgi:hypothetical protein